MNLEFEQLEGGIRLIRLSGELDIIGTGQVETKVAAYSAVDGVRLLIDLSGVSFLASIGIRMLMLTAKSIARRGGKMGLLSPNERVREILDITGIPVVIPIYDSLEEAQAAMLAN